MRWLILRQLKSKSTDARRKAAEQLCESADPGTIPALTAALSDEDREVRRLAVTALAKLKDDRCEEPLLQALHDPEPEVAKAAFFGLKRSSHPRVPDAMKSLLRHTDAGMRGHAAQVLEHLGWRPADTEEDVYYSVAKGDFSRAAAFGPSAIPALESVINSGPYSLSVGAAEALGEISDQRILRPLFTALKSPDAGVCVAAVDALSRTGWPQAVDPILTLLRHTNAKVRVAVAEGLRRLGDKSVVEPLRTLLRDPVWDVRRCAAESLGRLKDAGSIGVLSTSLQDADADVREASAMALGNIGDRRSIAPLVLALKDTSSSVRRIATAALTLIDPAWNSSQEAQTAVEKLKTGLQDGDSQVRHSVAQLLVSLGSAAPETAVEPAVEEPASSSSAKRRKLAVSLFMAILCDADRDLRQAAAEALGRLNDVRAQSALSRALSDPDLGVRFASDQALRRLGISEGRQ
jgi:HEAT repeat protein